MSEKSTTFGYGTKFSFKTPFKYPTLNGASLTDLFSTLVTNLYPTGKAFGMLKFSIMDKFHSAINVSFIRFIKDCQSTIDSCFPDNPNFNEDDCNLWEYRLGMKTNPDLNVSLRRAAIFRRMSRGRNVKSRQGLDYFKYQLNQAGFPVFVYENGFIESGSLVYKRPEEISALSLTEVQHSDTLYHGNGTQHGGVGIKLIANSENPNESFGISDESLWATFFIGGPTLGSSVDIPEIREVEFRELVLKLKPAHLVAFTFINYV